MEITIIDLLTVDAIRQPMKAGHTGLKHRSRRWLLSIAPVPAARSPSSKVLPIVTLDPPIPHLRVMKLEPALRAGFFAACAP